MSYTHSGIYIPFRGAPKVIPIKIKQINSVIECSVNQSLSIGFMEFFGYQLTLFSADPSTADKDSVNPMGSLLTKDQGEVYGNCLILDDSKDLTHFDVSKIFAIAKVIPTSQWLPEPLLEEALRRVDFETTDHHQRFHNDYFLNYSSRVNLTTDQRMNIWRQVKAHYVPPFLGDGDSSDDE